ncbi:putative serine hydrolase isoform X2 [Calliopsis andreniformis]|uniref:putative serine hydrolase isoform X2 n=1 Tax=Calliopsis andreniformis TaxID=337506 RepID=UPI003FCE263E
MSGLSQSTISTDSTNGQKTVMVEEITIPMPWGHISGKWWGPMGLMPIVALHGWQDNAGSFDTLIPQLSPGVAVLAIELPGHGLSTHYAKGNFFLTYWESVICLRRIMKYYKWKKVKLLGHSLGGAVSFLYAAAYPDEVDFVIALDIAGPTIGNVNKRAPLTGTIIDKFLEYDALKPETVPTYTYEDVLKIVENAYGDAINKEGLKILVKRGTRQYGNSGKYSFTRDPRLKSSALGLLSVDLIHTFASQIRCGYLNIQATKGYVTDQPEVYESTLEIIKKHTSRFEYHLVEGTHYVHLNNPEKIAPIINKFISTYYQ